MTPETTVETTMTDAVTPTLADATVCRVCGAELGWRDAVYARGTGACKRCHQRAQRRTLLRGGTFHPMTMPVQQRAGGKGDSAGDSKGEGDSTGDERLVRVNRAQRRRMA
ncbi:MAG TPA: hypothetical protein VE338_21230 [Ktedonobacterales bacterium]|nr:hypothetical protein [Ktedonobacterales bacterium]